MTVYIERQPKESFQAIGFDHFFSVGAIATDGPLRYQWYVGGLPIVGANSSTFRPTASDTNSNQSVYVIVLDDTSSDTSSFARMVNTAHPVVIDPNATPTGGTVGYTEVSKHSLLWNFKNDTFTWKDPTTEQQDGDDWVQHDVDSQVYAFLPGFQQRWEDYQSGALLENTWDAAGQLTWFQTFSKGRDKAMMVMSNGQLFKAEAKRNRVGSHKKYYVERTQLDFDGLSPEFRSGKVKQTKRFIMDIQGDQRMIARGTNNQVDMYVGWSMSLMDDPNYKQTPLSFNLQATDFGGSYKVDYRSSGRYMGMYFDMTEANQLSFTGGEIDVSQTSGR
jgi:hypothetical protein